MSQYDTDYSVRTWDAFERFHGTLVDFTPFGGAVQLDVKAVWEPMAYEDLFADDGKLRRRAGRLKIRESRVTGWVPALGDRVKVPAASLGGATTYAVERIVQTAPVVILDVVEFADVRRGARNTFKER